MYNKNEQLQECFQEFCKDNSYIGKSIYNLETKEYEVVITRNEDNAGLFLTQDELQSITLNEFQSLLGFLHKEFKERFVK